MLSCDEMRDDSGIEGTVVTASSSPSFWHRSRPGTPFLRSITDPQRRVASGEPHEATGKNQQ